MVLPSPVRLPVRVLADLVADLGLGDLHISIAPAPVWRERPDGRVGEHLTELGWRQRNGSVDREVVATLAVLCRPDTGFHGWISHDQRTAGVLAGAIGREGVLAVRAGDTVSLRCVGPQRLAERLVAQLPRVPPGGEAPLHVGLAELRGTDRTGRQRTDSGAGLRPAPPEVRRARRLTRVPTTGAGELHVTGSTAAPVGYVDTARGRYLVVAERDVLAIRPAGAAELVAELHARRRAPATLGNSRTPHHPVD